MCVKLQIDGTHNKVNLWKRRTGIAMKIIIISFFPSSFLALTPLGRGHHWIVSSLGLRHWSSSLALTLM